LKDSRYIEVVCPLDHPASDKSPFGQLVSRKAEEGGGWLTWVVAVDDLSPIEKRLAREAVPGHRRKPDGKDLYWKQIGVLDTLDESSNPFFIQWTSDAHPSAENKSEISLESLEIYGDEKTISTRYALNGFISSTGVNFEWFNSDEESGIKSARFSTSQGLVSID
jgi:hypothetical protein